MIDDVEDQIIFPVVDTLARDKRRAASDGVGLPYDKHVLLLEAGGRKISVPVEARGFCRKVGSRPEVIAFLDVAAVTAASMALGDFSFERHNAGSLCLAVRDSRKV